MKILITGSEGFIGKNLEIFLRQKKYKILKLKRDDKKKILHKNLLNADLICHLAGENRSKNSSLFVKNNTELTQEICEFLIKNKKKTPIFFTSTTKINDNTSYAKTKKQCEKILINYKKKTKSKVSLLRFPNVFGKWSKPNYNSVVSTFCYNISRKIKIKINYKSKKIKLLYIDDAIDQIYELFLKNRSILYPKIKKTHKIKVSEIAKKIFLFKQQLDSKYIADLSEKIDKDLFSTFISFIPKNKIFMKIKKNSDNRGNFVEYIKSNKQGQVSIFTIKKLRERGEHYHNSKVEKFLIIKGYAKIIFKNVVSKKHFSKKISEKNLVVFYSIPGWIHTIKNVGNSEIVGIVWANEIFNKKKTDTFYN